MLVKVAIDLALDRLFTYTVPEELEKKLTVGQLLCVSFGHRHAQGFAMELFSGDDGGQGDLGFALKPVSSIVDEVPFFSPELLKLVNLIAAYTASPVESVLKAALPAAVLKRTVRPRELIYVEAAPNADVSGCSERQKWLLSHIARLGGGWMGQLCRELKPPRPR